MDPRDTPPVNGQLVGYATFMSRARALVVDTALVAGALIILLIGGDAAQAVPGSGRVVWLALFGILFLYEPILVWRRGATIGHTSAKLRVLETDTGRPPSLGRAFARYVIKLVLGVPSFATMALTRRHQAVHDLATHTAVHVVGSDEMVPTIDYHVEPTFAAHPVLPSRLRRILTIGIYLVLAFKAFAVLLGAVGTAACADGHTCSDAQVLVVRGLSVIWLAGSISLIAAGWRGLLPGARGNAVADRTA